MGKRHRGTRYEINMRTRQFKRPRVAKRTAVKRARKLLRKPRLAVKKGLNATNIHCFARNRTDWINLLHSSQTGIGGTSLGHKPEYVQFNIDHTYCVIDLKCHWSQFPDCQDTLNPFNPQFNLAGQNAFKHLFSQYQITGVDTTLTPNFTDNAVSSNVAGKAGPSVQNYEIFIIPANKQTLYRMPLHELGRSEIDAFLNVTKAVGRRMVPSRKQTYKCTKPRVVSFDTAIDSMSNTALTEMTPPPWLQTQDDNAAPDASQLHVEHHTYKLLIRKVSGRAFDEVSNDQMMNDSALGFRLDQTIYFKCRTTPRDVLNRVAIGQQAHHPAVPLPHAI